MEEWFDDPSFWTELYPYVFSEQKFAAAEKEAGQIVALTGVRSGAILDLCCGPGRHSVALARRGYALTAVDKTAPLLQEARSRAEAGNVEIEFVRQDMRDFVRPGAFDLAINMFSAFGYFDDKKGDQKVLENLFTSLKPGGVLLMDMAGKEWLARVFHPTTSRDLPDGSVLVERHQIFDDWSRLRNQWILIKENRVRTFEFHHTIYSGQELKDRLLAAGFAAVRLFGDLEGDDYGPEATRLIALARKGDAPG
jgi:SAM-dependent methyltransferase